MVICNDKELTPDEKTEILRHVFGYSSMETVNDALNCYFRHPEDWGCTEEGVTILQLLKILDTAGMNTIKPEFDPLANMAVLHSSFIFRILRDTGDK